MKYPFNNNLFDSIEKSVLCWLATVSLEGIPNVSPKEVFTHWNQQQIIIANIASPQSAKNIKSTHQAAVSFIDIFTQKGFQVKGNAEVIRNGMEAFNQLRAPLMEITQGIYPFAEIFVINVGKVKEIIAPSYRIFPERTESDQIENALNTYNVRQYLK